MILVLHNPSPSTGKCDGNKTSNPWALPGERRRIIEQIQGSDFVCVCVWLTDSFLSSLSLNVDTNRSQGGRHREEKGSSGSPAPERFKCHRQKMGGGEVLGRNRQTQLGNST